MILGQLDAIAGHLDNKLLPGGPMYGIYCDLCDFLDPVGLPFSPLGVTILITGVWNGGSSVFCGAPDPRLDFGPKSDESRFRTKSDEVIFFRLGRNFMRSDFRFLECLGQRNL